MHKFPLDCESRRCKATGAAELIEGDVIDEIEVKDTIVVDISYN
jgi:hypothetical protein